MTTNPNIQYPISLACLPVHASIASTCGTSFFWDRARLAVVACQGQLHRHVVPVCYKDVRHLEFCVVSAVAVPQASFMLSAVTMVIEPPRSFISLSGSRPFCNKQINGIKTLVQ